MKIDYQHSDPLEREQILRALEGTLPHRGHHSLHFLGEGWDYSAWEVDSEYVFRFAKRPNEEAALSAEISLLLGIAADLPLRVPEYCIFGRPTASFPHSFAGYKKICGVAAPRRPAISRHASYKFLDQCGVFLQALHSIPIDVGQRSGIAEPHGDLQPARLPKNAADVFPCLCPDLPDVDTAGCAEFLQRCTRARNSGNSDNSVLHNDLRPDHILLHTTTGMAVGVIDWSDAVLGLPYWDMLWLWIYYGDLGIRRVLSAYGAHDPHEMCRQIQLLGVCKAVLELYIGLETNNAEKTRAGKSVLLSAFARRGRTSGTWTAPSLEGL